MKTIEVIKPMHIKYIETIEIIKLIYIKAIRMMKAIRKLYITLITLIKTMTTITVSEDTRVKVVRRKDEVLTSQDKVICDLLERAETTPITASEGPCSQCEEYKQALEIAEKYTDDNAVDKQGLADEINELKQKLAAANQTIVELESVSDVVVLDEDNEILG